MIWGGSWPHSAKGSGCEGDGEGGGGEGFSPLRLQRAPPFERQMWCAGQSVRGKMCGFLGEAKSSQAGLLLLFLDCKCVYSSQAGLLLLLLDCKCARVRARVHAHAHVHVHVLHAYVVLVRLLLDGYYK